MSRVTDADIEIAANDVMDILKQFESPKDAFSALMLAYWAAIKASFKPEEAAQALHAVKEGQKMLEDFIKEGWQ